MKEVTIDDALHTVKAHHGIIIDVRTPAEFENIHIKNSYNLPLDRIDENIINLEKVDKKVFLICRTGNRSKQACKKLAHLHENNFYSIKGGIRALENNKSDIVKGREKWDLERQVRFTAGLLVTTGMFMGTFISGYFYLLSAFVGLGLIYASITNTCAMGLLLSKLPYNQTKNKTNDINKIFKPKLISNQT